MSKLWPSDYCDCRGTQNMGSLNEYSLKAHRATLDFLLKLWNWTILRSCKNVGFVLTGPEHCINERASAMNL